MRRLVQGLVMLVLATAPHPPPPYLFLTDTRIVPGGTVDFGGAEFTCPSVLATLGADPLGDEIAVRPDGTFDARNVPVPADAPPGATRIEVSCISKNEYQSVDVQVVGAAALQRIALSPRSVQPGAVVTVDGTAFGDCIDDYTTHDGTPTPVQVSITLDDAVVATVPVTEVGPGTGTFHTTFSVPPGTSAADHPVTATCRNRFLPGSSTATATLTVLGATGPSPTPVQPGSGGSGGSVPQVGIGPSGSQGGSSGGSDGGIALIGAIAVAAIGFVALRRRLRTAGATTVPPPRTPAQQRPPNVVARAAGHSSGPARVTPGPGRDVSVRVVARPGGVR